MGKYSSPSNIFHLNSNSNKFYLSAVLRKSGKKLKCVTVIYGCKQPKSYYHITVPLAKDKQRKDPERLTSEEHFNAFRKLLEERYSEEYKMIKMGNVGYR